ncbi:MAG: CDP-glycerol glycerophosphotransferase family protein [Patescibacteria group bacterium]
MKTLFVTSFHPHISRNILSTEVLEKFKKTPGLRVVILAPSYKKEYFEKNFGGGNVAIEGVPMYQASKTKLGLLFKKLGVFLFNTGTSILKTKYKYYNDRKFFYFVSAMVLGFLGKFPGVKPIARFLDQKFSPKGFFANLIKKHNPDAIFSTDPQNENDVSLMHDARDSGVPVIAMLRSWDNTTQRILRVLPDRLLAGSSELKKEMLAMYKYPESKIAVTGNPHYDRYRAPSVAKEQFFKEFGFDLNKKLITFAPIGDHLLTKNDIDQYVMEILSMVPNVQILVRFPPDEGVQLVDFKKPENMFFDRPGQKFKDAEMGDREIRREDDDRLINELHHSDLIITGPTSISLDSAFAGTPVITANTPPTPRHIFDGAYTFFCDHIQKLFRTGGVRHAETKEDLLRYIDGYLKDPSRDAAGREKIRSMWFSHADGRAGERVANEVLKFVNL